MTDRVIGKSLYCGEEHPQSVCTPSPFRWTLMWSTVSVLYDEIGTIRLKGSEALIEPNEGKKTV